MLGDEGSGYWIGREALTAVMRAADGRGPDTGLTGEILSHFNVDDESRLPRIVYDREQPRVSVAQLTPAGIGPRAWLGLVVPPDPQLVLLFLPPLERQRAAVDFKFKIVFMPRQHLADGKTASCAVVKTEQHTCQIFRAYLDGLPVAAAGGRKRLRRCP